MIANDSITTPSKIAERSPIRSLTEAGLTPCDRASDSISVARHWSRLRAYTSRRTNSPAGCATHDHPLRFERDCLRLLARFTFGDRVDARLRLTRSGNFAAPVSRFHSSKVSVEILPLTSNSANLRRCAWLLNGMNDLCGA